MGVDLRGILPSRQIGFEELAGKKVAIDAYNAIYQFLAAIRQPDGTPLKDTSGNITSHLSGLFYRTLRLLEFGIKPCYVFDGTPPEEKRAVQEARAAIKERAQIAYEKAIEEGDLMSARKYAQQTSHLTKEMVDESKKLLDALGIPWVAAPGEGEAQAAYMTKKNIVWASASQDYDSVLFGAHRLVRNLTISNRRKIRGKYIEILPEMIELDLVLNSLKIDLDGMIDLALLIGTDYNSGIMGIGPKKALKIVLAKQQSVELRKINNYERIKKLFTNPNVKMDVKLEFKPINEKKVLEILHERHDFSKQRVQNTIKKLGKEKTQKAQFKLEEF